MSRRLALTALLLAFTAFTHACSDDDAAVRCESTQDCYQDEVCHDGTCQVSGGHNNTSTNNAPTNNDNNAPTNNDNNTYNTPTNNDNNTPTNNDNNTNNAPTNNDNNNDNNTPAPCTVPPQDLCIDDDEYEPNGSYYEYTDIAPSADITHVGCTDRNDSTTFQHITDRELAAGVCPATEDHFRIEYNWCRDHAFVVDIDFRVTTQGCSDDIIDFWVNTGGSEKCQERDDDAIQYYCYHEMDLGDGWIRRRARLPKQSQANTNMVATQIRVRSVGNTAFDYELRVNTTRL